MKENFSKEQRRARAIKAENNMMKYRKNMKFPICIGKFPECVDYTELMELETRTECRLCPYLK